MSKNILVVAAHPDDEVLGCGGTIAKHVSEGDDVFVIFLTDGETSRKNTSNYDVERRFTAAKKAASILKIRKTYFYQFPDNSLDTIATLDVIKVIENAIKDCHPEIVYTHSSVDLNIDHEIANKATLTACRPLPDSSVKAILTYEVLSSTGWAYNSKKFFQPNFFVDIKDFLHIKNQALACYSSEMRDLPHPRSFDSVKCLAMTRGVSIGLNCAEAFEVVWMRN